MILNSPLVWNKIFPLILIVMLTFMIDAFEKCAENYMSALE